VLASEYNSDRQLEISIWPPKPEINNYISETLTDSVEFGIFDDDELEKRLAK